MPDRYEPGKTAGVRAARTSARTLLGGTAGRAGAINQGGQIIGTSDIGANDRDGHPVTHAFLWQRGKMIDLGTLPGRKHSVATAINIRGQGHVRVEVDHWLTGLPHT